MLTAGPRRFRISVKATELTATIMTSKPPRVMTEKEVQATLAKASRERRRVFASAASMDTAGMDTSVTVGGETRAGSLSGAARDVAEAASCGRFGLASVVLLAMDVR